MNYNPVEIASFVNGIVSNPIEKKISHVSIDSRSIHNSSKSIFFALKTNKRNGHDFILDLITIGLRILFSVKNLLETLVVKIEQ